MIIVEDLGTTGKCKENKNYSILILLSLISNYTQMLTFFILVFFSRYRYF